MNKNIADPDQVKEAELRVDRIRKQELNDIGTVLSNASGRRFVWRLLERCSAFGTVFDRDHSMMSYLSGKQDLGHFIMAEISESDENLLFKLMKENHKGEKDE